MFAFRLPDQVMGSKGNTLHALIMEDEPLIATYLESILSECGFTSFDVAVSSEEAITYAERRCPDLITADVRLQLGNGIDAIQAICANQKIPVIFVTGSGSEVRERMPGHPMIEKPLCEVEFRAAIDLAKAQKSNALAPLTLPFL